MPELRRLVQELRVHEVEIDLQNEELRRAQTELGAARDSLRLYYDLAPIGFVTLAKNEVIEEVNPAGARLLNVRPLDAQGKEFSAFLAGASKQLFSSIFQTLVQTGAKKICELSLVQNKGYLRIVRLEMVASRSKPGVANRFLVIMSDVTEQKFIAEGLRRSEEHLSNFFNQAPIGLVWLAKDGKIIRANQAQLDLFGCPAKDCVGRAFADFVESAQARELLDRLAAQEKIRNLLIARRRASGDVQYFLIDADSFWSAKEFQYFAIFTRDITDRLNLEKEILHASEREQLRIAQDLHDGLGQILVGGIYVASMLTRDFVEKRLPESSRLNRIVEILKVAEAQTRSLVRGLHPVKAEPEGLMVALRKLVQETRKVFGIPCRLRCPRGVWIQDNLVAMHLFRIAQEALNNAIKHADSRRIEVGLRSTPGKVSLSVADDGVGMKRSPRHRTGRGLSIMHYRAGLIGGSLTMLRRKGGGTVVHCVVPVAPAPKSIRTHPARPPKHRLGR